MSKRHRRLLREINDFVRIERTWRRFTLRPAWTMQQERGFTQAIVSEIARALRIPPAMLGLAPKAEAEAEVIEVHGAPVQLVGTCRCTDLKLYGRTVQGVRSLPLVRICD